MNKNLKEKFFKLSIGEKICRKVNLDKIRLESEQCFFLPQSNNYPNIKKTIARINLQKEKIVTLYKVPFSGKKKTNQSCPPSAAIIDEDIVIEHFSTLAELLKKLKENRKKPLLLYYSENINKTNLYEICALLAKCRRIIGVDDSNSAYELKRGFFLYKILLLLFWSIPKFCLFFLTAVMLTPFVALFWGIMLVLMSLNSSGKKRA